MPQMIPTNEEILYWCISRRKLADFANFVGIDRKNIRSRLLRNTPKDDLGFQFLLYCKNQVMNGGQDGKR